MMLADTKDHLADGVLNGLRLFLAGSVLFTKSGASTLLNQRAVLQRPMYVVSHIAVAIPEHGILSEWLYYYLSTVDFSHYAHATTLPSLPFSKIKQIAVPVAPTVEQTRIADTLDELFSDLNAGVAALEQARDKLKLYRAAVLKTAVEGVLTADWRELRPDAEPAGELLKRILVERRRRWEQDQLRKFEEKGKTPPKNWKAKYKEPVAPDTADLPPLPEGWCWATLGELAWSSGYGTSIKCRETNCGLAVLRIPNIIGGRISLDDLKFAPENYKEEESHLIREGDLLVIRTNGSRSLIGRGVVVQDKQSRSFTYASYLIRLRLVNEPNLLHWVSILWGSFWVRRWIESNAATSAGQYNINLRIRETLAIPVPSRVEQEAIVAAVQTQLSVVEQLEADIDAKLQSAQALRQSILKHAFTGKLVPQDPDDEPASELLQRIAAERKARVQEAAAAKRRRLASRHSRK